MIDEQAPDAAGGGSVGTRLRDARIAAGLDLADVASRTRVPLRHLEAIEADDFSALPSPTYATGFAKAYARAVGVDEVTLAADVRRNLSYAGERPEYRAFEPADPARTPSRPLAWIAAIVAIVVLVGYGIWRSTSLPMPPPEAVVAEAPALPAPEAMGQPLVQPPPVGATAPVPGGGVVIAATGPVWLRVTDGSRRLYEREMAAGERYEVPADAADPRIITGRPQNVQISVGGRAIPPLGPADRTVSNVSLLAPALAAGAAAASPAS